MSCAETSPLHIESVATSSENDHAQEGISEPPISSTVPQLSEDPVATTLECSEPAETREEASGSTGAQSANAASPLTNSEIRATPPTTSKDQSPRGRRRISEDPLAKKQRDMLYMLNSQRRRRRARLGY
jgi:hypothetical protein